MREAMPTTTSYSAEISCRPMGGSGRTTPWGAKTQRTLSISEEGWTMATGLATHYGLNRSEVLEILIRLAHQKKLDLGKVRTALLEA
jgi:hypothetical protein